MRSHPLKVAVLSIGHLLFALGILYPQSLKYKHYSLEDGLPHNVGYDIHQDQNGYLWFGLDNGLARFDGQRFKNFTVGDGLNGPYAITLNEDQAGNMWTGIHMEGVNYVRQDSIYKLNISRTFSDAQTYHHKSGNFLVHDYVPPVKGSGHAQNHIAIHEVGFPVDSVLRIYVYAEKNIVKWKEMDVASNDTKSFAEEYKRLFAGDSLPLNLNLRQISQGEIVILSPWGVLKYDPEKLLVPYLPDLLPQIQAKEVDVDFEGSVWLLTDKELYCVTREGELEKFSIPKNLEGAIQFKVMRRNKVFFLSKNRDQVWQLDLDTGNQQEIANTFNLLSEISFIEKDKELNLWFTTMGDGVYCIYDHGFNTFSKHQGLVNSYINSVREDEDGSIFVCTEKGLDKIIDGKVEPVKWPQKILPPKKAFRTRDILSLGKGNYLISLDGPTYMVNPKKNEKKLLGSYYLRRFQPFSKDSMLLLTGGKAADPTERQLIFFDLKTLQKDSIQIHIDRLSHYITPYPDKNLNGYWLNPEKGLLFLKNDSLRSYPLPEGLNQGENIKHIMGGPNGNIWFATEKGILRHDGKNLTWVNKEKRWPTFACRQILFDSEGNMWMASPEGLFCWSEDRLSKYTAYGTDIRSIMIDSKNRLWVGTSLGVSYVELANFPFKDQAPNLIIESLELDGIRTPITELASISAKQTFHLDYVAVSFIDPQHNQYAYQLKEDAPWQYTSNRSLDLTGLQIGEYQLKIQARKFNSDWSKAQIIPFTVAPPWYGRAWAYVLFGLLLLGLILTISYLWGNHIKVKAEAQNRIAYEMGQLKLQALQSQLNPHFIFNALHVIQGYIIKNDIAASNVYLSSFSHLMRRFLESSKQNEIALQEEIELLNLFVEMEQLCYKDKFEYVLEVAPNLQPDAIRVPSMLIQPFVENAIHHGLLKQEGKGKLKISFSSTSTNMKCLIEDNGIGREKAKELQQKSDLGHTSRGMQIVSERLKLQNQHNKIPISIKIGDRRSEMGDKQGTQVEITWPLTRSTKTL